MDTPQYPHAAPREPGRNSGAHSTGGAQCLRGWGGGLALSERPGRQGPFPAPRPGQPLSTQLGGGQREGSARAVHPCPPPLQIPNSAPRAGLEACREGRCHATTRADPGGEGGVGMVWVYRGHYTPHHGGPGQEGHSRGRSRRPAPLDGQEPQAGWEEGQRSWQAGGLVGGPGPRQQCRRLPARSRDQALPRLYREALPGGVSALTLRENTSLGTFLPAGAMRWARREQRG